MFDISQIDWEKWDEQNEEMFQQLVRLHAVIKENIKPHKLERKEGITYYVCQHLEEDLMKTEVSAMWLGDERRVILCPLCNKLNFGNAMTDAFIYSGKTVPWVIRWYRKFLDSVWKVLDKEDL